MKYGTVAGWAGTALGLLGAVMIAANVGLVAAGYCVFLTSGALWIYSAALVRNWAQITMQVGFCSINVLGIVRWWAT